MRFVSFTLIASFAVGCGGSTTSDTSSASPGAGGATHSAGAGGGSSGAPATSGAAGANAGGASAGAPGAGGTTSGGTTGAAGKPGAAGGAGSSGAGGGGEHCCKTDLDCGDFAAMICVSGACKLPVVDACWTDAECKLGEQCKGVSVCPCDADCDSPDHPGACGKPTIPQNFTVCGAPGDCVLADATCCGACGIPKASDKVAVLETKQGELGALLCGASGPTACPDCIYGKNGDLAAFCTPDSAEVDVCQVVEVSKHAVSACATDADCVLHTVGCCDCGGPSPSDYVALSKPGVSVYEANLCGKAGTCLADCAAGSPPSGLVARCDPKTLHCAVTQQ